MRSRRGERSIILTVRARASFEWCRVYQGIPRKDAMSTVPPSRRAAIVAGVRTPFAKAGTIFRDVPAVALARESARELLYRSELDGHAVDEVIWGQVVVSVLTPNVGREVSLLPQFPYTVPGYSLNRACASGAQAITNAADQ